jgi:hypothetical protein
VVPRASLRPGQPRHCEWARGSYLIPDAPPNLVCLGDDAGFVKRQHLAVTHDELAVDHDRFDVRRLAVVNPRREEPPGRHQVRAQRVDDEDVGFAAGVEGPEQL